MVMMLVSFNLCRVHARVVDDNQVYFGGIFHIDVGQQFWAGDGPTAVAAGQREFFGSVADFGGELGRDNFGSVEFVEVNSDQVLVVVVCPLGMATGWFEVE